MKLLTFKISESLLEEMDKTFKEMHFANRTEFIRHAIREQLKKSHPKQAHQPTIKKDRIHYTG